MSLRWLGRIGGVRAVVFLTPQLLARESIFIRRGSAKLEVQIACSEFG